MLYQILKMVIFAILIFGICFIVRVVFYDFLDKHFIINFIVTVIIPLSFIFYMVLALFFL